MCVAEVVVVNVWGHYVVVDENGLVWNGWCCDGECVETFRCIEGS